MYISKEFRIFILILSIIAIILIANNKGLFHFDDNIGVFDNTISKSPDDSVANNTNENLLTLDGSYYDEKNIASSTPILDPNVITAKAYLVGNMDTGEIYLESNSDIAFPIASMSKLMTAYVASKLLTATTTIEIKEDNTKVFPDQSNLRAGEKFSFSEIMYPLLLNSSNVAAEAIATNFGRRDFIELMSSYAWEIGLPTTYFTDPSGLSPNNRASAKGFFELAKYIYKTDKGLFDITKKINVLSATTTDHGYHNFINIHPFVNDPRFIGGKTGRTKEAGDTMLTILNIDNKPIAFIVLGSSYDKRKNDTDLLVSKLSKIVPNI